MSASHWMTPLLAPRSVAVVGASPRAGSAGHTLMTVLRREEFPGELYLVNPRYEEIEGLACYPSVAELPAPPDLVVMCMADARLEPAFDDALAGGAGAGLIFGSCYLDGDTDPPLLERLRRKAGEAGMPVCGGNCLGFANKEARVYATFDPGLSGGGPGHIALFAQSGTIFFEMGFNDPRYRYNLAVSQGQEINGHVADYMDYALELPSTRVIALFMETVREPEAFVAALEKAAAREVPVVALKIARTEESARYAMTHSGGLAGNDDAFRALFDRYGVLRAETLDELAATSLLFSQPKRPPAGAFACMFDSGGMRELVVDLAEDMGLPFAEMGPETLAKIDEHLEPGFEAGNPLDIWSTFTGYGERAHAGFHGLVDDPATALGMFGFEIRDHNIYAPEFVNAAKSAAASSPKPVFVMSGFSGVTNQETAVGLLDAGVPLIDGVREALVAAHHMLEYRDHCARPAPSPPPPPPEATITSWRERLARGGTLDEAEGLALLADFGVPAAAAHLAEDGEAALAAAAGLGYPVVLKTAMPDIHHKSDVGGVRLGLADPASLTAAYDEMAARLGPRVTVEPMAGQGVELAFGMVQDAQFGALVLVGVGGVLIEVLRDRVFALPPFDGEEAHRLIDRLQGRALLDGVRGAPAADLDAVAEALARFSVLAATLGDALAEMDVNPVIAGPDGCLAVDALVVASAG
jgi:acyl-CoA synthetase (NDP forming)